MKRFLLLIILVIAVKFSYCQETYPRLTVIKGDTLTLLTLEQVKQINITYEEVDFLLAKTETLNKTIEDFTLLSEAKDSVIRSKMNVEVELKAKIAEYKQINGEISALNKQLDIDIEKIKKQRKMWFFSGVGAGVLALILLM